jgi:hypothetical protein
MNPTQCCHCDGPELDIVALAFTVAEAAAQLVARVRDFYYEVVLSCHVCPRCAGHLHMRREGQCACETCGHALDPTITFQVCSTCGGAPRLRISRYECRRCGTEITSRFLFDGLVFDAAYFRSKMAESRQRRTARRERIQQMLTESRSDTVEPAPIVLDGLPDLVAVLNQLSASPDTRVSLPPREQSNLQCYEAHVQAHVRAIPITFEQIPPRSDNALYDRVWRFIAILFLAQSGTLRVWQAGPTIWVMKHEADREGQAIPGNLAAADGVT